MPWHVHYTDETGSTNADLLSMARGGAPTGTVLRAGHQTAGRGRLGRSWTAPPGANLLVSILLRPERGPSFWDTATVALAAASACRRTAGVQPLLKWPNDLLVGDRKLAGVLAEADGGAVVVGLGLNVGAAPPPEVAARAVALGDLVVDPPEPGALLDAVLQALDPLLELEPAALRERWVAAAGTIGRIVRVEQPGGDLRGTATGITDDGALIVDGGAVHAGDVIHLR